MSPQTVQPLQRARRTSRVLASLLLLFACTPALRADIQLPAKGRTRGQREVQKATEKFAAPPAPVPTTVRLEPGGHAEVILRATGALGRTVDFLLRTPPAHGGFEGAPRRLDRDRVAVMYVHRAADGPGHDGFTFAAQAPGTPVSASETVDIEVSAPAQPPAAPPPDAPDVAATPADLDFGAVEAGRSSGVTLTLENRGGGMASGRLDLPAPWAVEGDADYRLGRNARQSFRLVFRPQREGSFAETLRVEVDGGDRMAGCIVRLVGTGLAAAPTLPSAAPPIPVAGEPTLAVPITAAVSSPATNPPPSAVEKPSTPHDAPGVADPEAFTVNEAQVASVEVRAVGTTTLELAWKPPTPLPGSYRVERRSFAADDRESDGVRIDWLLYDRVDYRVHAGEVTATLRGLVPGEPVTLRVVSVDTAGRLAPASPEVDVTTREVSTWWRPTPLKILLALLAVCLGFNVRRRWQDRQLVRELDARHAPEESPMSSLRE